MAEKSTRSSFDEADLLELAEALALDEPIPERLAATWDLIGHDPETLCRVEELRVWWLAMREGATAMPEPDLVLRIDRSQGLRIQVLHAATSPRPLVTTTRPVLAHSMDGRVDTPVVAGRTVRFRDLKVSISDRRGTLAVRVLGGRTGRAGVKIEALDASGSSLARIATDAAGLAVLDVGRVERVVLAFSPDAPPRDGDSSASPQV